MTVGSPGSPSLPTFESLFNFRDLGGHRGHDGRLVRTGALYRSDGLHHAVDADLDRIRALGVATVIDLRTSRECDEHGCFPADDHGVDYHLLPVMYRTWEDEGHYADGSAEFFAARYLSMLDTGADAIATTIALLGRSSTLPAVFHCAAGKDRTGVVAAIVLALLGVDDDEIAADYARSGPGVVAMFEWLQANRPEVIMGVRGKMSPDEEAPRDTMHLVMAEVRRRHGSVEGYARSIGVDADGIEALRASLLCEPAQPGADAPGTT